MSDETMPLRYARYLSPNDERPFQYLEFCSACRRQLEGTCHRLTTPDHLNDEDWYGIGQDQDRPFIHWAFCPWCGIKFADEWWRDRPIQNQRVIDHYRNPGTHAGDTHEFTGDGPDCMAGHVLASTGYDPCWCEPEIEPGLMGCTVRHRAVERPRAR